jgi:hypothetical protein
MTDRLSRASLPAAALAAFVALAAAPVAARAAGNTIVSGSVYVGYAGIPDATVRDRSPRGVAPDASLKVQVEIHDDLTFSAKACMGCHTVELDHAILDWQPKTWFNVQVGRIAVPFGEFAERVDPSSYRAPDAPLIYDMGRMAFGGASALNLGVLPQPYVDTGALAYGQKWIGERIQVWYGGYVVGGLKGTNDIQWGRMRGGSYQDNNAVPGGGGRLAVTLASEPGALFGDASIGGSFTAGRYDDAARLGYAVWGADATIRVASATVRGEYVQRRTQLDKNATYAYALVDDWFTKSGWYVEAEQPVWKYLAFVGRVDQLRRSGAQLPGADDPAATFARITRTTVGAVVTPAKATYVKAGWEYWDGSGYPSFHAFQFGLGGAF